MARTATELVVVAALLIDCGAASSTPRRLRTGVRSARRAGAALPLPPELRARTLDGLCKQGVAAACL